MHEVEVIRANKKISERTAGKLEDILRVAPYARVSTDSEEQLSSYKSQVMYYEDLVNSRKDWILVDIYADEAITGTQVTKREDFQRMINDCMDGKIDMVITKSISRFARNTLDTLKYVRMLKERNIAVFFEEENINTMTMDGELLLVILSSVAQQEVENISANVKKGLKMKMKRGELVGFASCLGYDYDIIDKSISINEAEAEIVRYIFERYTEGAGAYVIAKELTKLGYKTKYGNSQWHDTGVLGIIKNEKYKGDVLQGKTFTVDPISKRRLDNHGEEDQFYVKDHHEPIISEEVFDKAQAILSKRGAKHRGVQNGKREKYSRKYAFSSMLECAFCGSNLSRRNWHSGTKNKKVIWQCVTATKKGKKYCPLCKAIEEKIIEDAFVESYKLLCYNNSDVLDELLKRMESVLSGNDFQKRLTKIENEIQAIEQKRNRLIDMRLEEIIDKATYEMKYGEIESTLEELSSEKEQLEKSSKEEIDLEKRIEHFKKVLEKNEVLTEFDRCVFESIVDKVIVGEIDEDENANPYKLTFVYKTDYSNTVQSKMHKQANRKRTQNDVKDLSSYSSTDTIR
ncbi:DNA invertase Pin-like site-specific DNA recombinase [Alkalibaculum bacchi]|uniref:DNA invertase Pin-like site-specific DNA recombinase n=1 Tax=Alkalibaculum bacchi TaxID=645887 RepID=A0A366HZP9_9FIRM|nr:recombinase family protein [Alkalibaculum bacchi]RBP58456.1 DNA invertase Pin-like site-specific DNA recombinase [Alkalibaculum bacchi]